MGGGMTIVQAKPMCKRALLAPHSPAFDWTIPPHETTGEILGPSEYLRVLAITGLGKTYCGRLVISIFLSTSTTNVAVQICI